MQPQRSRAGNSGAPTLGLSLCKDRGQIPQVVTSQGPGKLRWLYTSVLAGVCNISMGVALCARPDSIEGEHSARCCPQAAQAQGKPRSLRERTQIIGRHFFCVARWRMESCNTERRAVKAVARRPAQCCMDPRVSIQREGCVECALQRRLFHGATWAYTLCPGAVVAICSLWAQGNTAHWYLPRRADVALCSWPHCCDPVRVMRCGKALALCAWQATSACFGYGVAWHPTRKCALAVQGAASNRAKHAKSSVAARGPSRFECAPEPDGAVNP